MRIFVMLLHLILFVNISNSQTESVDYCYGDSLYHKMIIDEFKTKSSEVLDFKKVFRLSFYYQDSPRTDLCIMRMFALLFDQLLYSGLDVHFDRKNNTYYRNSTDFPVDSPLILKINETNLKIELYDYYFFLFEQYKKRIKLKFDASPDFLEFEVNNLVKYGNLMYPITVRDILLLKLEPDMH